MTPFPSDMARRRNPTISGPGQVQGVLDKTIHWNSESCFCIARIIAEDPDATSEDESDASGGGRRRGVDQVVTVKGVFPRPEAGVCYAFEGEWQDDPKWGPQLKVREVSVVRPSSARGIEKYLASGLFPNIGPARARAMVEAWGVATLDVLDSADARAKLDGIHGITPERADRIVIEWHAHRVQAARLVALYRYGLTPWQVGKLVARYGDEAADKLAEDPYQVIGEIPRFGFLTVDGIAGRVGIPRDDIRRARAAVVYLLEEASTEGHCYLPLAELKGHDCQAKVRLSGERIADGLASLIETTADSIVVYDDREGAGKDRVALKALWDAERKVASRLRALLASPVIATNLSPDDHGIVLTPEQQDAVLLGQCSRVLVVTGGPGTGKTTVLQSLMDVWRHSGMHVELAAPTGKAAQRMTEATGHGARTIHRLLHWTPDGFDGFEFNAKTPLDADVVVIDESSMIDVELAASLLDAIDPRQTRLVLVGDVDQLPSVGPGQVLGDLIASGACPVVRLTQIMRQNAGSAIVRCAHAINAGRWEEPDNDDTTCDLKWCAYSDNATPEEVASGILDTVCRLLPETGYDPIRDIQVLAPMKRGTPGVGPLNRGLQDRLNPPSPTKPELMVGQRKSRKAAAAATETTEDPAAGRVLRLGDKVIQTRNNYRLGVFNGEVGFVSDVNAQERTVEVDFGDLDDQDSTHRRIVAYGKDDLYDLWTAYALTVHKSQGSEFSVVVMPIHTTHWMMLRRRLLYTAVTRAKKLCVILGTERALRRAVRCNEEAARHTRLEELLRKNERPCPCPDCRCAIESGVPCEPNVACVCECPQEKSS